MSGHCCHNCFNDSFIKIFISTHSESKGKCSFCGSKNVEIIKPEKIASYFQPVVETLYYKDIHEGEYLSDLLREDWGLFETLSKDKAERLLSCILGDKHSGTNNFKTLIDDEVISIQDWEQFRDELKYLNRYFPRKFPDSESLVSILSQLEYSYSESEIKLYRARINKDVESYDISSMGKPPNDLASAGRANPIGISYLYASSDQETAVSELRPHSGDRLTLAELKVIDKLFLIDLRNPKNSVSPFKIGDEELLRLLYSCMNYLAFLGDEISKPISRYKAQLEYLPTQYLCEFIKSHNYDGLIYKSSVGPGFNVALFHEDKVKIISISVGSVDSVSISFIKD